MTLPVSNMIYTFAELMALDLPDCPHLQFIYNDEIYVIQTSHMSDESLMNIPGILDTRWQYEKTTREAIPIFWGEYDNIANIISINDGYNATFKY